MASALRPIVSSSLLVCSFFATAAFPTGAVSTQGIFQGSNDIGHAQPGGSTFDAARGSYEVRGGGEDVWGTADNFRFTWKRVQGDASLAADIHINAPVTNTLAKGMLMFRQSLDPGSAYADIAIHADGHITLQYRLAPGGVTADIMLPEHNAERLRIVRHADAFTVYAHPGNVGSAQAPSISIPMNGLVYVGVGVCSHNTDALQTVAFSKVDLTSR